MASLPKRQKLIELADFVEFLKSVGVSALVLKALYFVTFDKARDDYFRQRLVQVLMQLHQNIEPLERGYAFRVK